MTRRKAFLLFIGLLLIIPIVNCGSSSPKSVPVISGTLPNGNVGVAYSGMLTVTGGVAPFTWTITELPTTLTFPPAGNGNTVTISGTPLSPVTVSGNAMVTDSKGTSSAAFPFSFMITSTLAITPTELSLMADTPVSQALTVNPATMGPYTWTVISGALPPGNPALMLSNGITADPKTIQTTTNTVTITGTPNSFGSFPFIIQVTDSVAPTPNTTQADYSGFVSNSNASACKPGNNNAALPAGTSYAFLLRGFDATDDFPIAIAGSFTAGGDGTVTAADVDYNGITLGPQNPGSSMNLAASLYSFSLENGDTRGCLSLVFNTDPAANRANAHKSQAQALPARRNSLRAQRANSPRHEGVPATPPVPTRVVFQFALGGQNSAVPPLFTTGNIIEFDNGDGSTDSWASGVMHLQDPTAFNVSSLAANFAFGLAGWDPSVNRAALAGSFANAGGSISSIFADFNDNGTASGELTGGSGMINAVDPTTGRAKANFTVPGGPTFDAVIYVINANDFYVLSTDQVSTNTPNTPLVSGRALATSNTFTAGALNGFSLLASEGFDATNFANDVTIGTAQFSSAGNTATASFTQSDAGTVTTPAFTGTYTVDATNPSSGRVSFNVDSGTDTTPPVVYLTSGGDGIEQIQGFSVGTDANVGSGILVTQSATAPAFTASSVSGTYAFGSWEDVDGQNGSFSGVATFTAPSTYSAVEDMVFVTQTAPFLSVLPQGTSVPGTFTITPAGTGAITVGANPSAFVTNGEQIFSIAPGTNPNPDAFLATYTNIVAP
jgi:hypothetical protein